jgi:hypothetical protein
MNPLWTTLFGLLTVAGAGAQQGAPHSVHTVNISGVRVRYLDFGWNPEAFEAMETGGSHSAAARSWAVATIRPDKPLQWEGHGVPASAVTLIILNPRSAAGPMTIELRTIDMREVFTDMNVVAIPPEGETIHQVPANFETVKDTSDRLAVTVTEPAGKVELAIQYGNRKQILDLTR